MSIVEAEGSIRFVLPDTALGMWERGELHDYLHFPHDGTKVEVIDGKIAVTASPHYEHNAYAQDVVNTVAQAWGSDPAYPWRAFQGNGVLLPGIEGGYIPDVIIVEATIHQAILDVRAQRPAPDELEMVVEVTSERNAGQDREPSASTPTKWRGYARSEIPYYLLIDRDPKVARTTLYSIPNSASGAYLHQESWPFGETIHLPDPFLLNIPSTHWKPWT